MTEPPPDSRFTIGEILVPVGSDSVWFRGGYYEKNEATYAGVYWDPFDRFSNIGRKWDNGAVWLGVEVDEVLGRDIQIYPHPLHPKYKWFTRLAGTKLEGYGRTQRMTLLLRLPCLNVKEVVVGQNYWYSVIVKFYC